MIAFLSGRVAAKGVGFALLEVSGVGYRLSMTTGSLAALKYQGFTDIFGAQLSWPWIRTRQRSLNIYASLDALESTINTGNPIPLFAPVTTKVRPAWSEPQERRARRPATRPATGRQAPVCRRRRVSPDHPMTCGSTRTRTAPSLLRADRTPAAPFNAATTVDLWPGDARTMRRLIG